MIQKVIKHPEFDEHLYSSPLLFVFKHSNLPITTCLVFCYPVLMDQMQYGFEMEKEKRILHQQSEIALSHSHISFKKILLKHLFMIFQTRIMKNSIKAVHFCSTTFLAELTRQETKKTKRASRLQQHYKLFSSLI